MKERPILFSGPMVRALLNGSKTQTRRIVKLRDGSLPEEDSVSLHEDGSFDYFMDFSKAYPYWQPVTCPYGQPGDRLTVKEDAWMWCAKVINGQTKKTKQPKVAWVECRNIQPVYCADHAVKPATPAKHPEGMDYPDIYEWHKKIGRFLPRWASRITLEITGIRVERLKDIRACDCIAEGIESVRLNAGVTMFRDYSNGNMDRAASASYRTLWESINGKGSWDANPWVWVVEFKKLAKAAGAE